MSADDRLQILRELQAVEIRALVPEPLGQELELGGLSRPVGAFEYDQFSHNYVPLIRFSMTAHKYFGRRSILRKRFGSRISR